MIFRLKYPSEKQIEIWNFNREKKSGREIALLKSVTPGFVSKTLKEANERIKDLIINTAKSNKITINESDINEKKGFAKGYSPIFNTPVKITFPPVNGIQLWYEHKGECALCSEFDNCRRTIIQEFKDRNIKIENESLEPTELSEILLNEIEKRE